jgi:hypothetical protein
MAGFCGYSNEPLASIKGVEFLHQLSDFHLLKKGFDSELVMLLNSHT